MILPKVEMITLNDKDFKQTINLFQENGIIPLGVETCVAYVVRLESIPYIVINFDEFDEFNDSYQHIIIAHECAHAIDGITDEEEADEWTFPFLTETEIEIMKNLWVERHNRTYEEYIERKV